jgi:hypothetical protein
MDFGTQSSDPEDVLRPRCVANSREFAVKGCERRRFRLRVTCPRRDQSARDPALFLGRFSFRRQDGAQVMSGSNLTPVMRGYAPTRPEVYRHSTNATRHTSNVARERRHSCHVTGGPSHVPSGTGRRLRDVTTLFGT